MGHPHPTTVREYTGMCDASASALVDDEHFLVANDEDNLLRIYRLDTPGPIRTFDWGEALGIAADDDHPEADIEAATRLSKRMYWITSHGANKEGKPRPNRRRFFATDIVMVDGRIELVSVGTPYRHLIEAMAADVRLAPFQLAERAMKAPESAGGLNMEGLTSMPDGKLLIGFRNPVPDGQSLLIPLENPAEVLTGGPVARFGDPIRLSLGGLGIRSMDFAAAHSAYFIVAGPIGNGVSKLFRWSGVAGEVPKQMTQVDFGDLNPEAVVAPPAPHTDLLLLSDDGGRLLDGKECKKISPDKRKFRSLWVTP